MATDPTFTGIVTALHTVRTCTVNLQTYQTIADMTAFIVANLVAVQISLGIMGTVTVTSVTIVTEARKGDMFLYNLTVVLTG